jgi:hypothetical protein
MPVAINLPDAHLCWSTWADYPDLNRDSFCSFRQAVDLAIELGCPLILPGDVINKSVQDDGVVVGFLSGQLRRMREESLEVYFTVGQHERTRRLPWLSSLGLLNVHHVNEKPFVLSCRGRSPGLKCYGLDFQPAGKLKAALEAIPAGTQVLVCHQVWEEFMGEPTNPEGSLADIPHVKVVLTGDFHGHKTLQVEGKDGRIMNVVSSGSTHMRTLIESPEKYLHVLYSDLSVQSRRIATRPLFRFSVLSEGQLEGLLDGEFRRIGPDRTLPGEIQKPMVHLEYEFGIENVRARALKALEGRAFLFDRPIGVRVAADEEMDEEALDLVDQGLEGCLTLEASEGTRLYDDSLRLLRTPPASLAAEVAKIAEEWMAREEEGIL